ncbi:MAG: helix-turn-helix domain-containing protein [Clostridia bacterium]
MVMEAENWLKEIQGPQLYGIFRRKMKDNMTDSQIAEELGYSRSRITQIINKYLQLDKD